jgi:hypothetical protein
MERIETYRRFLASDSPPPVSPQRAAQRNAPLPSLRAGARTTSVTVGEKPPGRHREEAHRTGATKRSRIWWGVRVGWTLLSGIPAAMAGSSLVPVCPVASVAPSLV